MNQLKGVKMQTQTKEQFIMLHGRTSEQSKSAKAAFDVLFNGVYRGVAAREYGVSEQSISAFIKNNESKHIKNYLYVQQNAG